MQDRPTALELLEAVRAFVEEDVAPALDRRQRFHALVSANLLAIVQRELQFEEAQLTAEWERLRELLGQTDEALPAGRAALRTQVRAWTEELAERIRRGDADAGDHAASVRQHVSETVREKLRVANPRLVRS
jgi:hypothetical protein